MFTARINHSRDTLKRFTIVQYDTFEFARKVGLAAISVVLIVLGFFMMLSDNSIVGIVFLALGCLIITNLNSKAQAVADSVAEAMKEKYPVLEYTFGETGFTDGEDRPEVAYRKIYRLISDDRYIYIFTSKASGYMMELSSVSGGSAEELKSRLSEMTGLEWTRPLSITSFSLKDAVRLISKKKGR